MHVLSAPIYYDGLWQNDMYTVVDYKYLKSDGSLRSCESDNMFNCVYHFSCKIILFEMYLICHIWITKKCSCFNFFTGMQGNISVCIVNTDSQLNETIGCIFDNEERKSTINNSCCVFLWLFWSILSWMHMDHTHCFKFLIYFLRFELWVSIWKKYGIFVIANIIYRKLINLIVRSLYCHCFWQ